MSAWRVRLKFIKFLRVCDELKFCGAGAGKNVKPAQDPSAYNQLLVGTTWQPPVPSTRLIQLDFPDSKPNLASSLPDNIWAAEQGGSGPHNFSKSDQHSNYCIFSFSLLSTYRNLQTF